MDNIKQDVKVQNSGTASLFDNRLLERLTRTPMQLPIIFFTLVACYCLYYSFSINANTWYQALSLYAAGMLFFSLIEYCIHRFLFHFEAKTEKEIKLQYKIHGVHHEYPKDKDRLVMPIVLSLLLSAVFYFLFRFTMGKFHLAFFSGFMQGYCVYLCIHFAIHRFRTPKNFLKILWHHHSIHHYGRNDSAFAVSMPVWDYIFGTMPKSKSEREEGKMTEKYL